MDLKNKIDEILTEIKKTPYLSETAQDELLKFFDSNDVNEGDAGKLVRLNNSAFSVRKKNNKIPTILKIIVKIIEENVRLRAFKENVENLTNK